MASNLFISPDPLLEEVSRPFEYELIEEARRSALFPLPYPDTVCTTHDVIAAYMGG
jgi:hypothetical protein